MLQVLQIDTPQSRNCSGLSARKVLGSVTCLRAKARATASPRANVNDGSGLKLFNPRQMGCITMQLPNCPHWPLHLFLKVDECDVEYPAKPRPSTIGSLRLIEVFPLVELPSFIGRTPSVMQRKMRKKNIFRHQDASWRTSANQRHFCLSAGQEIPNHFRSKPLALRPRRLGAPFSSCFVPSWEAGPGSWWSSLLYFGRGLQLYLYV